MVIVRNIIKGIFLLAIAVVVYGVYCYADATKDAAQLKVRADQLIADGKGPDDLGPDDLRLDGLGQNKAAQLLLVQDPGYYDHSGIDLTSKGAGITTLTQSLAKRVGFSEFKPGIAKFRQTAYAMGLEAELSKEQIFALFLDSVEMGKGPDGWMTGFFNASRKTYGKEVNELSDREFLSLVAVMIAPAKYNLRKPGAALTERVTRIEKLIAKACEPLDLKDVWLEGCK